MRGDRDVVSADRSVYDGRIMRTAAGDARPMDKPAAGIDTNLRLHAEVPRISLLRQPALHWSSSEDSRRYLQDASHCPIDPAEYRQRTFRWLSFHPSLD
jgi:hypothetical protein